MPKHNRKKKPTIYRDVEKAVEAENNSKMRSGNSGDQFFIDKKGTLSTNAKTTEERKTQFKNMQTQSDQVLASNPAVPNILRGPQESMKKKRKPTDKQLKAIVNKFQNKGQPTKKQKLAPVDDLWAREAPNRFNIPEKYQDLEVELRPRSAKVNPHTYRPKPSAIPDLILPQPGQSYRPSAEDHADTLGEALAVANFRNEEERNAVDLLKTLEGKPRAKDYMLRVDTNEVPIKNEDEEEEEAPFDKPNPAKRKTKKQKRKEAALRQAEGEERYLARIEKSVTSYERIDEIRAQLDAETAIRDKRQKLRDVAKEERKKGTPYYGTVLKFKEDIIPVATSDEIAPNLRTHKTLAHPLYDRYVSLIRTGKVPPRTNKYHKPADTVEVEKYSVRAEKMMTQEEASKITATLPPVKKHIRNKNKSVRG